LITGMMARHHYRGPQKQYRGNHSGNRNAFAEKIFRISDADSAQAKQMKPVIEKTMTQIDSLENHSKQEVKVLLDSMKASFKSILKPEQMEKLNEFTAKMGHSRHRGRH
ncbi:MAG: hypothetical protein HOP30_16580, partial [Cyclobacteriaceae bacterium]|nr:hypothetical protein [Cyclobacteriaceae bacterium]